MTEKKIYFELKPDSPTITRISHGEYTREFQGVKWPYEATEEEWMIFLLPTGLFKEMTREALTTKATKGTKEEKKE